MSDEPMIDGRPLSDLKVVELKKELEKYGLSKAGVKNVLYDRLKQYLQSSGAGSRDEEAVDESTSAPSSNPLIAEYLRQQQEQLQAARKDAERVRAAEDDDEDQPRRRSTRQRKDEEHMETSLSKGEPEGDAVQQSETTADDEEPTHVEAPAAMSKNEESESTSTTSDLEEGDELDKLREHAKQSIVEHRRLSARDSAEQEDSREAEHEDEDASRGRRRRRWGGGAKMVKKPLVAVTVDADSLQHLMKAAEETTAPTPAADDELDYEDEETGILPHAVPVEGDLSHADRETAPSPEQERSMAQSNRIVVAPETEASSLLEDEDEYGLVRMAGRTASPARYPVDCYLHIRCLTRPFTVKSLQQLLGRFGTIDTSRFWIDNIKTNCIVKFSSTTEAELARSRLHNAKWPLSNPKSLRVDFASEQVLDRHIQRESTHSDRPDRSERLPERSERLPERVGEGQRIVHLVNEETEKSIPRQSTKLSPEHPRKRKRSETPEKTKQHSTRTAEREWDKGKRPVRDADTRRHSPSPSTHRQPPRNGTTTVSATEELPKKTLDELFRKTKTTPCVYWLPLTEQQIIDHKQKNKTKNESKEKTSTVDVAKQRSGRTIGDGRPSLPTSSTSPNRGNRRRSTPTPPRRGTREDRR